MRLAVRALALVTDGFGGHGGIARYNEAFLRALAGLDRIREVVVVQRSGQARAEELPARLCQLPPAPGKAAYVAHVLALVARRRPCFDLLFCGHINVAALGAAAAKLLCCPWWLQVHGIDAWDPPRDPFTRGAVAKADLVTAVSRHTRRRFLAWADLEPHRVRVLPNTVDPRFTPGAKPMHLLQRYGLVGKRVLLTVGRLSAKERYKGHDRVIAALPGLRPRFRELAYVVIGDGDDRPRLEALARELGVADVVLFLGQVPDDLAEHYRMADLFVMPSIKEGFGIVFLEAMACGVPAIGGDVDGSTDPLSCSPLGKVVPPEQLAYAIAQMLENPPRHDQPRALVDRFGRAAFAVQLSGLTASFTPAGQRAPVLDRPIPSDLRSSRLRRRRSQASP